MTTLEQLVRRIGAQDYRADRPDHFIYDDAGKTFLRKPPMFRTSKVAYFEVTCSSTGTPSASGTLGPLGVTDHDTGHLIKFSIHYDAWILASNAEDLVRSVASSDPGARIVELVTRAVRGRVLAPGAPTAKPDRINARDIERALLREHGLSTSLRVEVDSPAAVLQRIELEVPVHLIDHPEPVVLRLGVSVSAIRDDFVRAEDATKRGTPTKEALAGVCREFFVEQKLQHLLDGTLNEALRERVREELARRYLQLRSLQLRVSTALQKAVREHECKASFEIHLQGYPSPVRLNTQVFLQLVDRAVYYAAGAPDLDQWIAADGAKVVRRVLSGATYSELCLNMSRWTNDILGALQAAARTVGYSVKAHITRAEPGEARLLSPFPIEVSGEFATATQSVSSQIQLVLRLQLESLQSVARDMDKGHELTLAFQELVREELRSYIHTLTPGFLFTRFSGARDYLGMPSNVGRVEPVSVEQELQTRISSALHRHFGVKVLSFTAKLGRSPILDCYDALLHNLVEFTVDVKTAGHIGPVTHHGTLRIDGVAEGGWPRFQNLLPDGELLSRAARDCVLSLVAPRSSLLQTIASQELDALVHTQLPIRLRESFGIEAEVSQWYPDRGEFDVHVGGAHREVVVAQLANEVTREKKRLARLAELEEKADALEEQGEFEEAERVRKHIEAVERRRVAPAMLPGRVIGEGTGSPERKQLKNAPGPVGEEDGG